MIKESLPLRVLAISFLLLALPLLIDSFIFFQSSYENALNDVQTDLSEAAEFRAFAISEIEPIKQVLLKELAVLLNLEEMSKDLPSTQLNDELSKAAELLGNTTIFMTDLGHDKTFKILASSNSTMLGKNPQDINELNRVIKRGQGDFLFYLFSEKENRYVPYLILARVLETSETKEPYALIFVATSIEAELLPFLKHDIAKIHDFTYTVSYAAVSEEGIIFAAGDPKLEGQTLSPIPPDLREQIDEMHRFGDLQISYAPLPVIREKEPEIFEFIFSDKVQLAHLAKVPKLGLSILAYSPKEQIFGRSIRHFLILYAIYGLVLVGGGAVTYWLTLWMSRPLNQLSVVMRKVGGGTLDVRFKKERLGFEINILGEIFNDTLTKLLENIQQAEDERVMRETYAKELEIGLEVQQKLLPQAMPEVAGVELDAYYSPAEQAGGDFYQVILKEDGKLLLSVADAAGKGVSACLYALTVRSLLSTFSTLYDDIGRVMSEANNLFCIDTAETGNFLTAISGIYDDETKHFSYYSCGHVPGFVFKESGEMVTLSKKGLAMGVALTDAPYQAEEITLEPGDLLLLYSDGLFDVRDSAGEPFSIERVCELIKSRPWKTAAEVINGLVKELTAFIGDAPREEEITILAMRVK